MTADRPTSLGISATDVDTLERAIAGFPLDVHRLSAHPGPVGIAIAPVDDVGLLVGEFGFPIVTEGEIGADTVVLAIQLEPSSGSWNGRDLSLDRAWIYGPGSEHYGVAPDGPAPRFATVSIPVSRLADRPDDARVKVIDDNRVQAVRSTILQTLAVAASGELPAGGATLARREIVTMLSDLTSIEVTVPIDDGSAGWITRSCIELTGEMGPQPSSAELGVALAVSDRWIRAAFHKVYGVSPTAFFRSRALHGAHRDLAAAEPATVSVTDVAMRWGFWHLGRFSGRYHSLFGELPKETLARTS